MRLLLTTALVTALTVPALAQSNPQTRSQAAQPTFQFVTQQKASEWSAEALIGRTVYNMQDENLGDINNVILGEDGRVSAVTIGVGGFLGIGEKNVGVPFKALEFRQPQTTPAGTTPQQNERAQRPQQPTQTTATQNQNRAVEREANQTVDRRQATGNRDRDRMDLQWDREHSNMRVYLNATKEQLENAPEFAWLDERNERDNQKPAQQSR
jgi:hypothetical protein